MAINLTFNLFMNTMNKLYKCALGLLTAFILSFACFSSAENVSSLINNIKAESITINSYSSYTLLSNIDSSDYGTYCIKINSLNRNAVLYAFNGDSNDPTGKPLQYLGVYSDWGGGKTVCLYVNLSDLYLYNNYGNSISVNYSLYKLDDLLNTQLPVYSSLQCQTEYNLIPISEVTPNYCALNFGMIDPQECPINQGTGEIVRSNLMINDVPYAQNQNINVFIPDFLAWNISFNDLYTVIDVEGYNADESYIENVINQEKLTPTNKDFEEMITGFMTNYFPYLALAIVFLYLARKIFKLFK